MRTRLLALACAALVAAGCGSEPAADAPQQQATTTEPTAPGTPSAPAQPSATPATSECPAGGLIFAAGPIDAASGLRVLPLQIRNCGDQPITIRGYPSVVVYQDGGPAIRYATARGGGTVIDPGETTLSLAPGAKAWASLSWRNTLEAIGIDPIEGDTVVLRMPDGSHQKLPATIDMGTTGRVELTAWQRGRPRART